MEWLMCVVWDCWPCKSEMMVMVLIVVASVLLAIDMLVLFWRHASYVFVLIIVVHLAVVATQVVGVKVVLPVVICVLWWILSQWWILLFSVAYGTIKVVFEDIFLRGGGCSGRAEHSCCKDHLGR